MKDKSDYLQARLLNLTELPRWEKGMEHHQMSQRLMNFLALHDWKDYNNYFDWRQGGDGDNGETLMYQMDAFFELLETKKPLS